MRNEIYHHGILGQKWGIRRFQNKDGTRTSAGKKRYNSEHPKMDEKTKRTIKVASAVGAAGAAIATAGIIMSAHLSEIEVSEKADRAIRKAKAYIAEGIIDKNADVRESSRKGLDYLRSLRR